MSIVQKMKDKLAAKAAELADTMLVDPVIATDRMNICRECPSLLPKINVCSECGCAMVAKTKLKSVSCPLGKWLAEGPGDETGEETAE